MGSDHRGRSTKDRRTNLTPGLDPIVTGASSSSSTFSKLELVQKAFMAPFSHKKNDSTRILSEREHISSRFRGPHLQSHPAQSHL